MSELVDTRPDQSLRTDPEFASLHNSDDNPEVDRIPESLVGSSINLGKRGYLLSLFMDINEELVEKEAIVELWRTNKKLPEGKTLEDVRRYLKEIPIYRKATNEVFRHVGEFDSYAVFYDEYTDPWGELDEDFVVQQAKGQFKKRYDGPANATKRKALRDVQDEYAKSFDQAARSKWAEEYPVVLPESSNVVDLMQHTEG